MHDGCKSVGANNHSPLQFFPFPYLNAYLKWGMTSSLMSRREFFTRS